MSKRDRQLSALHRLEKQLNNRAYGHLYLNRAANEWQNTRDRDKVRIEREIVTLRERLGISESTQ